MLKKTRRATLQAAKLKVTKIGGSGIPVPMCRTPFLFIVMLPLAVGGQEPVDWLPPPPVRLPFWDSALPEQIALPADDFTRLLEDNRVPDEPAVRPRTGRQKQSQESLFEVIRWKSKWEMPDLRELRDEPALSRDWQAEQSLNLPLPLQESLFMFGQFATGGDVDHTQSHVKGRTGLGWKYSPFGGTELQVRTGPVVSYTDDQQTRTLERSQLSVEMQAKLDLFGPLQLQYAGEALPSFAQADRHQLLQDVKVAVPFGTNRELSVGAKYRWEETLTPTPWLQRAEIYMGLRFQR